MVQQSFARNLKYLPVLDEPTIWTAFNRVYTNTSAKPLDHYFVNMLLAICAVQGPTNTNKTNDQASKYLAEAVAQTTDVFRPGSVTSIQALLLLAVYAYLDSTYFDYWTLIGFASRAMVDIGMHHDPPKSSSMPRPELDLRRRVFWCVYSLDRLASMTYKRPFSFSDDSTGVASASNGSCTAGALALFKLRQIQSEFYAALYQPSSKPSYDGSEDPWAYVWRIYGKLGDWLQTSLTRVDASSASVIDLEYNASCAFLLGSSPRCPSPDAHAMSLRLQHVSRFTVLLNENGDLFYLRALESLVG